MTVWGAIAGGFTGTLAMTTLLRAASELGLTRIDIPFLLGTAVSVDRTRAKVVGFALHFTAGLLFAMLYYACFIAINRSGWWIGAGFGVVHALFAGTTLVNILLPFVHPRMGTSTTAADSTPLLEPPGFMLLNYGRSTPVVNLVAHLAYGALVGGLTDLSAG
jgi:hypothetical protein